MQILRDLFLGWLTYVMAISALIGVFVLARWLYGPPITDRDRSLTFVAGGGGLMIASVILGIIAVAVTVSIRSTR